MGDRFEPNPNAEPEIAKQAMSVIRERAQAAIEAVQCPEHGEAVRFVTGEGEALGRIEGCCDLARKLGQDALSQVLEGS